MSKSAIQQRMYREAAEVYKQYVKQDIASLDGFDPLVLMLINTCADELAQLETEVRSSQVRMLKYLAQLLTPDAYLGPTPAQGILYAPPSGTDGQTDKWKDEFIYSTPKDKKLYFTPAGNYQLINGELKCIAHHDTFACLNNGFDKEVLARSFSPQPLGTVWLGLKIAPESLRHQSLQLYFDVPFEYNTKRFEELLATSQWSVQGVQLHTQPGIESEEHTPWSEDMTRFHLIRSHEKEVHAFYRHKFLRVTCPSGTNFQGFSLAEFPEELSAHFYPEELSKAVRSERLLWIKAEFSRTANLDENLLRDMLGRLLVQVNCFPVINRRIHNATLALDDELNLFALRIRDSHFYGIESVKASKTGQLYVERPFSVLLDPAFEHSTNKEILVYALRRDGVQRFDERSALDLMENVLRIVREESLVYNALGKNILTNNIKNIQKSVNDIQSKLMQTREADMLEQKVFLAFPAIKKGREQAYTIATYWSTNGEDGRNIPAGEYFKLNESSRKGSVGALYRLLSTTRGGSAPLLEKDHLNALRAALVVRDKIVTAEDIQLYCRQAVGEELTAIRIEKGVETGKGKQEGFLRILKVNIQLAGNPSEDHRQYWEDKLQSELNEKSAGYLPIRVAIR